jgi:hypothetical protein
MPDLRYVLDRHQARRCQLRDEPNRRVVKRERGREGRREDKWNGAERKTF